MRDEVLVGAQPGAAPAAGATEDAGDVAMVDRDGAPASGARPRRGETLEEAQLGAVLAASMAEDAVG